MSRGVEWLEHWKAGARVGETLQRFGAITDGEIERSLRRVGVPVRPGGVELRALENRVFRFPLENSSCYVKLYRPGCWSSPAVREEISFLLDIKAAGLDAIRPLLSRELQIEGMYLCAFEGVSGHDRTNCALGRDDCIRLGWLTARLHDVGARRAAPHRRSMHPVDYVAGAAAFLSESGLVPPAFRRGLNDLANELIEESQRRELTSVARIHGDLGLWNVVWSDRGPIPIDFDDMGEGPAVQDLAQAALGIGGFSSPAVNRDLRTSILTALASGYGRGALPAFESNVALILAARRLHVSAWIASRWTDARFRAKYSDFAHSDRWSRELAWIRAEMQHSMEYRQ